MSANIQNKFGKKSLIMVWCAADDIIIWPFGGHPLMVIFRWFLEKKTKTFTFFSSNGGHLNWKKKFCIFWMTMFSSAKKKRKSKNQNEDDQGSKWR